MTHTLPLAIIACFLLIAPPVAQAAAGDAPAPSLSDPPEAEVQAVLGPDTKVQRTGPGQYVIDGEATDFGKLLHQTLPEREKTLKAIAENIDERIKTGDAAANGVSLDSKRAECQALPVNSIPRTRCYQELEMLRDQSTQSAADMAQQRNDDELERDKLSRAIDAIDAFETHYGGDTAHALPAPAPIASDDKPDLFGAPRH
jgi:hypothetical protein